jgi:hypothetical protein
MKRKVWMLTVCIGLCLAPVKSHAQIVIIKEILIKVIKAIDLAIQKQQNKVIWLQNAQKTLENTMSKLKLDQITDWVNKQKELYQDYYDDLKKVKDVITYYQRIKTISQKQVQLVEAYKRAFNLFRSDNHFTLEEIAYMEKVYSGILDASVKNLDQVYMVISSFTTTMTDEARLAIINKAADALDKNYRDLTQFNTQNKILSLHRSKDQQEVDIVRALYGIH